MKNAKTLGLAAVVLIAGVAATQAFKGQSGDSLPPLPENPAASPVTLVEAHPFELIEPATHYYRAEQPSYTQGWVLVLSAPADLLVARQTAEPVLYVGEETAERINVGETSGNLVVVVPDLSGQDLSQAPIFFGDPELPERVTLTAAREQLSRAIDQGARAAGELDARLQGPQVFEDTYELHFFASHLVERYAGTERDLIEGLRAPRVGR